MNKLHQHLYRFLHTLRLIYWRVWHPVTVGVQICVQDAAGHYLVVHTSYRPGWELPGGGPQRLETLPAAAARELIEETGIRCRPTDLTHIKTYTSFAAGKTDHISLFRLQLAETKPSLKPQAGEIVDVAWVTLEELPGEITQLLFAS